ncbi:MAG: putative lipid II flippase FtsW [bacterium]|nr:putative lipid II flippase FtsW [bacterium]
MKNLSLRAQRSGVDKPLLFTVLGLLLFGVVMVFNASLVDAIKNHSDKFFFIKRQAIWTVIGLAGMVFLARLPYLVLAKFAKPILIGSLALLIAVLIPGISNEVLGARRWIGVGSIVIQPAEIVKFAFTIYLAATLTKKVPLNQFLLVFGSIVGLVMLEPDLGTTIVISTIALSMYFAAGAPLLHFAIGLPSAALLGLLLILSSSYRRERLLTFFNPGQDPLGTSYHISQVLIALGSGGLFGVGLGQSRQKYLFLPEPATDSIFAIIGEELGFVGSVVLIAAFVYLIWRGYQIALKVSDPFGKLLAIGITSWLGAQVVLNLGAMVALVPLTGIPLPLVSYGGSSLVVSLAAIGTLLNISKQSALK